MEIDKSIFKSYDIRGVCPDQLNEATAFNIGKAFVRLTGAKKVAVCNDARISGPELLSALARGIISEGGQLSHLGQLPTECLYFAVGNYDFPAGVMVTASHNPKEYNGFKMIKKVDGNIEMVRGEALRDIVGSEDYTDGEVLGLNKKDILKDYTNHILRFVDLSQITPLKIIVDASSGVAGKIILEIRDKLPVEIIPINFEPNGDFPNHSPNPLAEGSINQISDRVKAEVEGVDFGLIFDGDADRIFLVDERGQLVRADVVLLILARYFLKNNAGSAIAYNAICSKAVPEFIKKWGGLPVRTKVGFVNVREGLLQNNGIMGGELSGHYCFKDNFYMDSGMIAMLILMQEISADGRKVSEIVAELSPYKSAEINFKVTDKDAVLEGIKEKFADGKQDFLDGITAEYKDWWFNARPSNTEPLLRLTIEADTEAILDQKQKELIKIIK